MGERVGWGRLRSASSESGQIAVIGAVTLGVVLLFAALCVDVGGWYSDISRLQTGADAAAISGAVFYAEGDTNPGGPCAHHVPPGMRAAERGVACASYVAALNGIPLAGSSPIEVSGYGGSPAIEVDGFNTSPPNFLVGGLLGLHPHTQASGTASLIGTYTENNVVPVGVTDTTASNWDTETPQVLTFDPRDGSTGQYFTLLRNDFGCMRVPGERTCIANGGCGPNCTVTVGDRIRHDNGSNWLKVESDWNRIAGQKVLLVVYSETNRLHVAGFVQVTVGSDPDPNRIAVTFDTLIQAVPAGTVNVGPFYGIGSIALTR